MLLQLAYLGRSRRYPGRPDRLAAHLVSGAHNHAFRAHVFLAMVLVPVSAIRFALWVGARLSAAVDEGRVRGRWSGVILRSMWVGFAHLVVFALAVALPFTLAVLVG
jgi:hypothetical protein